MSPQCNLIFSTEESAVLAEIEGRSRGGPKQSSRTMAMLEQHLEDL